MNYTEIFKELNKIDDNNNLIREAFETHSTLNQKLFDGNVLREDVRKQLIKIADIFIDSIKKDQIPIKVYDYWMVGSNAAYNYSDVSDIDIHIIVDINSLGMNPYLISLLYNYIKSSFNDKYDIKVKGHEVELYLEDIKTTAITNGIYSLKQDKWIKEPTSTEIISYNIEETELWNDWYERYQNLDEKEAEQFLDDLYMMRKMSLANDGEWGTGNLIFKEFRNRGYLDDLKNKKYKYRSDELTLEKLEEDLLCESTYGMKDKPYSLSNLTSILFSGNVAKLVDDAIQNNKDVLPTGFIIYSNKSGMGNKDNAVEHHVAFSHLIDEIINLPNIQTHTKIHNEIRKQVTDKYKEQLKVILDLAYKHYLEDFQKAASQEGYDQLRDKLKASEDFFRRLVKFYNHKYKDKKSDFYTNLVNIGIQVLKDKGYMK